MKIIKNGRVVTPSGVVHMDVSIKADKIFQIAEDIKPSEEDIIVDATGCYVCPGFIDGHTHLDMSNGKMVTADNFETGTKAALAGGTTMLVDFATQEKGGTLKKALSEWKEKAKDKSYINYGFHMAITDWNEDVKGEIKDMLDAGVSSFKIYFAYDALKVDDYETMDILLEVKKHGGLLGAHCENGDVVNYLIENNIKNGNTTPDYHPLSRPAEVEAEAVNKFLYLSKLADYPVNIVHLSSGLGLKEIRQARENGQKVFVESCPQYLLLDDSNYSKPDFEGAKYVLSPPLRKKEDMETLTSAVLWEEIDTIATDHCSYNFHSQKTVGRADFSQIPNGGPGIEHRVNLMYTKLVDECNMPMLSFVKILSETPAKIYGVGNCKGKIQVGYDGDIVLLETGVNDTITAKTQYQNVDYTPYEGFKVKSRVKTVIVNGEIAMDNGCFTDEKHGKYIKRNSIRGEI